MQPYDTLGNILYGDMESIIKTPFFYLHHTTVAAKATNIKRRRRICFKNIFFYFIVDKQATVDKGELMDFFLSRYRKFLS
jgi:hypothetical protein